MTSSDFTTTLLVDQTPKEAFNAINNPRGWWSAGIEGGTDKLNDEFIYHYKDIHYCKIKLTELVPNQKVVWLVLDNYFQFTEDKSEWKGTKIIFEISQKGNQTQISFTHEGLVPQYECYEMCREAWTNYIAASLRDLILTGKGQPNNKEDEAFNEHLLEKWKSLHISFVFDRPANEVFNAINDVTKWWTEELEGRSQKLNDEFTVRFFDDVHVTTQKLVEVIPDKKVVWLVTDSRLNFVNNKGEWTDTQISFEISSHDNKTQLDFTHFGLGPQLECYDSCKGGWERYINGSLVKLLTEGKGRPELK
jgi:hypothetical protein